MKLAKRLLVAIITLAIAGLVVHGGVAFAQTEPSIGESVTAVVDAWKTGQVLAIVSTAIMLLVNLLKLPLLGGVVTRIPKRWRVAVPIALGGIAAILAEVTGGVSWAEALVIGLLSGPGAVFAHEAFVEALLGRSKSRGLATKTQ